MSQQNNKFTAFWMDTTTAPWTPLTGLSATINIRDVNWNLVVENQAMIELWGGHYIYTFVWYNPAVDYVYDCNPGATAYRESGVTNNIEQLISEIRTSGGWFSINYGAINSHTTKKVSEAIDEIKKIPKTDLSNIESSLNEINSHIELAKTDVIDTIESNEKDDTEINKSLWTIKSNLTKLSQFVRNEAQKEKEMEKEWMKTEYESKISELVDKMEEMEDAYEELDWSIVTKEKLIEDMEKTAQEIIDELEKQKELAKSEWEKGIKEKLISSLSE